MKYLKKSMFFALALSNAAHADAPAVHGMLFFGDTHTYVSHLPMFHAPHDYQGILKVNMADRQDGPIVLAYKLAKQSGQTLFTIKPKPMDLSKILSGAVTRFGAVLYNGHFERGGQPIGSVTLNVEKIIFAAQLNVESGGVPSSDYLLFGQDNEYFSAHLIGAKPSFDQMLKISPPYVLKPCRFRCDESRSLQKEFLLDSQLPIATPNANGGSVRVEDVLGAFGAPQAQVTEEFYFEADELSH